MKKFFIITLAFIMMSVPIYANESIPVWNNMVETMAKIENKVELDLDATSVILLDEDSGTILYAKNEHEKLRPASVTKVMTLLLTMEALERGDIKLTDKVPCSTKARKMGGSQIWLNENEELTVDEMVKAICVVSANDCSVAMAEFISGSEEAFAERMNKRARELNMNDTSFKNAHGIDEEGHLTSAYDIAIMSRELSKKFPKIHEYTSIWMDTLRDGASELVNTNKLVRFYSGCTGLKTGSTSLAGFNVSATAVRNDLKLIAVVMHGTTSSSRFEDAKKLLDYGFANFANKKIVSKGDVNTSIKIFKGVKDSLEIIAENDLSILTSKGDDKKIRIEDVIYENVTAPVKYLDVVGVKRAYLNDDLIGEVNLVANENINKKSWFNFLKDMFWSRLSLKDKS